MNLNNQNPEPLEEEEQIPFTLVRDRYPSFLSKNFDLLQLLRDSAELVRTGWRDFLLIFAALQVPLIIVSQLILPTEPEAIAGSEAAVRYFPTIIFFTFVGLFVTVNVLTASRYVVMGAPKPLHEIFKHSIVKFPIALIAAIGVWGIVMVSFLPSLTAVASSGVSAAGILLSLLLLIPALVVMVYASLFLHSITLGDRGVITGLIHGFSLVKGNWWRSFSLYLVVAALILPIALPLSFFNFIFEPGITVRLLIKLVVGAIGLLATIPSVLLYYNLLGINSEIDKG